jgi:hypothetical protein
MIGIAGHAREKSYRRDLDRWEESDFIAGPT